jgi:hypothetical protein
MTFPDLAPRDCVPTLGRLRGLHSGSETHGFGYVAGEELAAVGVVSPHRDIRSVTEAGLSARFTDGRI